MAPMSRSKDNGTQPKVPAERADLAPNEPSRPSDDRDRPGFDLGGAKDKSVQSGTTPKTEPSGAPPIGNDHPGKGSQLASTKGTPA